MMLRNGFDIRLSTISTFDEENQASEGDPRHGPRARHPRDCNARGAVQASISGGLSVRNLTLAAAIAALWATSACKKTGEGEYEVQKPTVGTTTDTVHTPSVETGTAKDTISVPKVTTEKKEIRVPKVKVTTPDERKP
jgi:hypothetical protein